MADMSNEVLEELRRLRRSVDAQREESRMGFEDVGRRFNTVDESFAKVE